MAYYRGSGLRLLRPGVIGSLLAALLVSLVPGIRTMRVQAVRPWKIAFVAGLASDLFYITMNRGVQAEAKTEGLPAPQFTGSTSVWGASYQIPFLHGAIAQHPDLILVAPTDVVALHDPIVAATKAGIRVILVDTTLNDPSMAVTTISTDNRAGGMLAADALATAIGPKGGMVAAITTVAGISTTDQRVQGFNQELKKYPQLKNIGPLYIGNTPPAAIMKALVAAHKVLAGVFATIEGAGYGITSVAGLEGLKLVEFDASPEQVAALKAGRIAALVAQYPYGMGRLAVKLGVEYLNGDHNLKKHYGTPSGIITPANVNDPKVANFLYTP